MTTSPRPPFSPSLFDRATDHMTASVPIAAPREAAGAVLERMRGQRYDVAAQVAVCEDGRLVGLATIERLLAVDPDRPIIEVTDTDPPVVGPGTGQEEAGWKAVVHGEGSIAVVGDGGRFLGIIPGNRLLAILLWAHDEDMARFGGLLRGTTEVMAASEAAVAARFWHRLPWLLVGLVGSLLSVDIIRSFEVALREEVSLAFFVPGVVYLADAVGTQTEALVIRGLPLGISIRRVFLREVLAGLLVGVALAGVFFPVAYWRWGQLDVSMAVAVSLFAACSIATIVAMALPWLLQRARIDPAFGSGPLATVIQDLLSIVVYFVVASLIVV